MNRVIFWMLIAGLLLALPARAWKGESPNGKLTIEVNGGHLKLRCADKQVMDIVIDESIKMPRKVAARRISEDYMMLTGKRLHCTNEGNEYRVGGMVIRLYNDGLALCSETASPLDGTSG